MQNYVLKSCIKRPASFSFSYTSTRAGKSLLACTMPSDLKSIHLWNYFSHNQMHCRWSMQCNLLFYVHIFQNEILTNAHLCVCLCTRVTLYFKHDKPWNIYEPGLVTSCSPWVCSACVVFGRGSPRNVRAGLQWDWMRTGLQEYTDWIILNETGAWVTAADGKLR